MENNTEKIGGVTLVYDDYIGKDLYVDGSEEILLELVKNNPPSEYNRLIKESGTWAVLYHLSHIRGNIVDFLPIGRQDKVLEIGAGCGAITGTLAKKAGSVECIELSKARSLVNAYRNREYDNITIKVGNFQDVEAKLTEQYDYITLIGVFEYAKSYIQDETPFDTFLSMIKKHLAPGGKIVIAIENKFGLKYFAGCREDHLGIYYTGLEGYPNSDSVETFSKDELTKIAMRNGLEDITFYYPYPDYKLPQTVYSDDYLPEVGELSNNYRNFDGDRMINFNESKVFDEIVKDGKFPFFSNSFLVLLGEKG